MLAEFGVRATSMTGSTDFSAALERALTLAKGDAAWKAVDELAAVWRNARDGALGDQLCGLGEDLLPTDFPLREVHSRTVRDLRPSGALLAIIVARIRRLVAHDSAVEEFLRVVMKWSPDPRLGSLGIWVLSKDNTRKGAREAAAELFLKNADQHLCARLGALAETTLPTLRAEVAGIVERCKLPPAKEPPAPHLLAAAVEIREVIRERLSEARAQVVRDVKLAIAAQQDLERRAAAKEK
jgi:hypothetical protein